MTLAPGCRLGPYEVLAPLGAGGMGEVWRARDTRLGRDVAIKVLPDELAGDRKALARFEGEARAVAALSHPNILALHDVGEAGGVRFTVTELLEGETLRGLVKRGPVPVRRALEIAQQVAEALAAAHEKGIVHRDVKPENVFLTKDGHAKVLDFGLSRRSAPIGSGEGTKSPTVEMLTGAGAVVGTITYMSPEQAQGLPVDFRSDQFSLGVVLYEMLAGKRPFTGASAAETLTAIIRQEPPPLDAFAAGVPAPVRWFVDRCLAKDPDDRYRSTLDLARELATWRLHLADASSLPSVPGTRETGGPRKRARAAALLAFAAAAVGVAFFAAGRYVERRARRPRVVTFQRLTFRRGAVQAARFAPDGRTVVYGAAWDGKPIEVFSVRTDGPESRALGFPGAGLLAVSRTSDLALALESRLAGSSRTGTLARVPFSGGAPRPLEERIHFADFSPDGGEMALARETDRGLQLEYPAGKVLYRAAPGWLSEPRVSRSGDLVAFLEHPGPDDPGWVAVVDRAGRKRKLTGLFFLAQGLAWSPSGEEVWFSAARTGGRAELRAVTLDGKERALFGQAQPLVLRDVFADGRVLATNVVWGSRMFFRGEADAAERELSWLDNSWPYGITPDGSLIAFLEAGAGAGPTFQFYVRETSGSPAMRLGPGRAARLSPDGRFVVATQEDAETIAVYPIGPGPSRTVTLKGVHVLAAGLLPDGKTVWFWGRKMPGGSRYWLTDLSGSAPRPATPELKRAGGRLTPDGRHFLGAGERGLALWPVLGGEPRAVNGVSDEDTACGFSTDSRSFYVYRSQEIPLRLRRVDVETGRSEVVRELVPADPAGVHTMRAFITPDGKSLVYGIAYELSELYLIEGLR